MIYENIKTKLKSKATVLLIAALLAAVIIELLVFVCDLHISGKGDATLITEKNEYQYTAVDCTFDGVSYRVTGADPQIIYTGIYKSVRSVVLELKNPAFSRFGVKLYYETPTSGFSEANAKVSRVGPFKNQIAFKFSGEELISLRLDIDDDVEISSISLWDTRTSVGLRAIEKFSVARVLLMFLGLVLAGVFAYAWYRGRSKVGSLSAAELSFVLLCLVYFTIWNMMQHINYAPDELMRLDVNFFLFEHGRLPVGDELTHPIWGFSYAHTPTMLCNVLGYIFMCVMAPFSEEAIMLVIASRMVSVLVGVGTVYFVIKTSKMLFDTPSRWIMIILCSFIPQFAFLSSYVNNDSLAVFGSAMIFYCWVYVLKNRWNYKIAFVLVIGMSVCALSYYNSYGWILISIPFLIITYFRQNPKKYREFIKFAGSIAAMTLVLIGYLFIRHFVLYGDILGMSTGEKYGELFAQPGMKPSERFSLAEQGVGIADMLFGPAYSWVNITAKSFFVSFGYMQFHAHSSVYVFYGIVFGVGALAFAVLVAKKLIKREKIDFSTIILYTALSAVAAITVFLSMYNSYFNDFQAQGRYCYPALIPIVLVVSRGIDWLISLLKKENYRYFATGAVCSAFITVSLLVFKTVFEQSLI